MSAGRLSRRLARVACDLDDVAQAIATGPLSAEDEDLLGAPADHVALAYETLEETLHQLSKWGRHPRTIERRDLEAA